MTLATNRAYWWSAPNVSVRTPEDLPQKVTTFRLNKDFGVNAIDAKDLTALIQSWQAGAFSTDTLLELLRKGEILPEGRTNEQELRMINKKAVTHRRGTETRREDRKSGMEEGR